MIERQEVVHCHVRPGSGSLGRRRTCCRLARSSSSNRVLNTCQSREPVIMNSSQVHGIHWLPRRKCGLDQAAADAAHHISRAPAQAGAHVMISTRDGHTCAYWRTLLKTSGTRPMFATAVSVAEPVTMEM